MQFVIVNIFKTPHTSYMTLLGQVAPLLIPQRSFHLLVPTSLVFHKNETFTRPLIFNNTFLIEIKLYSKF